MGLSDVRRIQPRPYTEVSPRMTTPSNSNHTPPLSQEDRKRLRWKNKAQRQRDRRKADERLLAIDRERRQLRYLAHKEDEGWCAKKKAYGKKRYDTLKGNAAFLEREKQRARVYRENNKASVDRSQKKYRENHRKEQSERTMRWASTNKEHLAKYKRTLRRRDMEAYRMYERNRRYKITKEQWDCLLEIQKHACAICGCPYSPEYTKKIDGWCVDHDHSTDEVRGILCRSCNFVLGFAKDNQATLLAAVSYLTDPPFMRLAGQ